jgi:hypothetical protein
MREKGKKEMEGKEGTSRKRRADIRQGGSERVRKRGREKGRGREKRIGLKRGRRNRAREKGCEGARSRSST